MNPDRWAEVSRLFTTIVERPPTTWPGLLDELCGHDDEGLRHEVERLLEVERLGTPALDEPVVRVGEATPVGAIRTEPGLRAGPYRLLRPIGRGALSEVFLAVRDDDAFRRRVAVKLIRSGIEGRSILSRFQAERQILATLDHPNIARLFDGGTAEDGRPFLAMEYVDGLPITEYCDRWQLGIASRLRLFLDVCSAVQHAHQSLLVHRDLKPGNILVTTAREVKLLDFGIAKPLGPLEGLEPRTTQTGHRPMTPVYASPEQVRGEAITTASDVYSLGVLLHELLTGRRPYRLEADLAYELERAICEQEIRPPSQLARARSGAQAAEVEMRAQRRDCSASELRRRLSGDLDTIVLRTLRKEPSRRYYSARQLGGDVERHLSDRPIVARQDHLGYRLVKFVRRNRGLAAAACGVAVLVGGFLSVLRWQATLVEASRSRAEQVSDLLLERLATGDPEGLADENPVPREVLDLSLRAVGGRMLDDPAALAEMLETMGRVYQQAGLREDAHWMFEESLGLRRRNLGEEDLSVASSLHSLGLSLLQGGELDRGETLLREALELRRQRSGETWAMAESLEALGRHSWRMGALDEAEPLLRESLEVRLALCPDSAWTARGLSDLGEFLLEQQKLEEAQPLQARAAAIRGRLNPQHFDNPRTLEDKALLHFAQGEPRLAESLFRKAADRRRSRVGESHETLSVALVWQARSLIPQGRHREAVEALREALVVHRRLRLGEGAAQADLLKYLGVALAGDGESDAGEAMLRTVIERESSWVPADHPRVAMTRVLLADVVGARGDLELAERLYLQAASDLAAVPEWEYGAGAEPRLALARLHLERGDLDLALEEARDVLELLRERHPVGHRRLAQAESLLGSAFALADAPASRERLVASSGR